MSLKHGLLGLLQGKPMTGYDLTKTFNKSLNFFWHAQMSQIYRDLGTLEKKGMVVSQIEEQEGKPDKKIYTITQKGNEEFQKWLDDCNFSDSLKYRDIILIKLFFGSKGDKNKIISGLDDYVLLNEEHIIAYKRTLKMLEKDVTGDNVHENIAYMKMTVKKGFITAKGNIEWAKECISTLSEL